jgi:hypothetical protein
MATQPNPGPWISPVRLYKLADGTVVEESGVTDRAELLVGAGGSLPRAQAEALGLVKRYRAPAEEADPDPAIKAQAAPPATKQQASPPATKSK